MPTFGKTTDGTGTVASNAVKATVSLATPGETGTVQTGAARLWLAAGVPSPGCECRLVIYADSSGVPAALLAMSDVFTLPETATTEAEHAFTFSGANMITVTVGTPYQIGVAWNKPNVASGFIVSRDGTPNGRSETADVWTWPTPPNPFGTVGASVTGVIDVYITYLVPSGETRRMRSPARFRAATI